MLNSKRHDQIVPGIMGWVFISTCFMLGSISLSAQVLNKPSGPAIPSANATTMSMYGEVPVSLYTGVPNIEIPVYTVEERGVSMPIVLRYHAQGFKPEVHPSSVGQSWALDFGGSITRKLNNLPDEWLGVTDGFGNQIRGYYYSHGNMNNPNWSSPDTLAWRPLTNNDLNEMHRIPITDKEPDVFNFNFMGYSGSFYLDHLGNWKVQCDQNIKVVFDEADFIFPFFEGTIPTETGTTASPYFPSFNPKTFGKFTLIDDKGIQYVFGKVSNDEAIEYSSSITPPNFDYRIWMIAQSWYLKEVLLPGATPGSEGSISIGYVRGPLQSNFQYTETKNRFWQMRCDVVTENDMKGLSGHVVYPVYPVSINISSKINVSFSYSKSNELAYPTSTYDDILRDVSGSLPGQQSSPLAYPNNYFNFTRAWNSVPYYVENGINIYNTSISSNWFVWLKLNSISISSLDYASNLQSKAFKRVSFNYDENSGKRLRLLSVDFKGVVESEEKQTYSFAYNNYYNAEEPPYLKNLGDHWGFANAKNLIYNSSTGYQWLDGDVLLNRAPSEVHVKGGVLKEITYPAGGKTLFEYEINKYGKYLPNNTRLYAPPENGTGGGLRIKKITTVEPMGYSNAREYYYVEGYQPGLNINNLSSSGVLDGKPIYNFVFSQNGFTYTIYSNNTITPSSSNSGALCGYSQVVEKYMDGAFKIYKFTNFDNGFPDADPIATNTPYTLGVPYRSKAFERGRPLSEEIYNADGKLINKMEYNYIRIGAGDEANFVRSLTKNFGGYCNSLTSLNPYIGQTMAGFQVPMLGELFIAPESYMPKFTTATAFGYYTYKIVPEKIKESVITYEGNVPHESVKERTNTFDNLGNVIKSSTVDSKGDVILEQFKYPYHFTGTTVYDEMIQRSMTGIIVEVAKYRNETQLLGREVIDFDFFNNNSAIKPRYLKSQIGNNTLVTKMKFNKYDGWGNVSELEDRQGIKSTFLYSYGQSRLVAKLDGVGYDQVTPYIDQQILTTPYQGEQPFINQLENLRAQFPGAFINTYYYDYKGGYSIKQSRDILNRPVSYSYDNLSRLSLVKDMDNFIVKKLEYKFLEPFTFPFKNTIQSAIFNRSDCPYGYNGSVSYTVPADKYGSFISIQDANQKALNDIAQNGQNYANANGVCAPYWSYVSSTGWSSYYSNFTLNTNNSISFTVVIMKSPPGGGGGSNSEVGTLSGPLFLPTTNKYFGFSSNGVSGLLTIYPNGKCYLSGGSGTTTMQISGTYTR